MALRQGFFYIFIYMPIYLLFTCFQRFYWLCNGMYDIVTQIESGQLYERSAHIFDIRWKRKKEPFQLLNRNNFIATHRNFEHPHYVLKPTVSLLCVQLDMAIFIEVPEEYDIFDVRKSPFMHLGQFDKAYRIITLPIPSLIELGIEIGDPKNKIVWLHSTGRCGSTAVGAVFDAVPDCITISEPMCIWTFRSFASEQMDQREFNQFLLGTHYRDTLQAIIRLMTKPIPQNPKLLLIKNCTTSGANEVQDIESLFPSHVHLFLYRDCLDTVQSYMKSLNAHFMLRIVVALRHNAFCRFVVRTIPVLLRTFAHPLVLAENEWIWSPELQQNMTAFGLLVLQWGSYCYLYKRIVAEGSTVRAIRYEDIVQHKRATLTMLFEFCGIPLEYVEKAELALESDSQEGTVLSRNHLAKNKQPKLSEDMINEGNLYLTALGFPLLKNYCYLPNVLSPSLLPSLCNNNDQKSTNGYLPTEFKIDIPAEG